MYLRKEEEKFHKLKIKNNFIYVEHKIYRLTYKQDT
jgi:hypothetical protein